MYIGLHVWYHLFLRDFNENWIFLRFFKNTQIKNFMMKIHPVGFKLFHADGQMDGQMK